MVVESPAKAKTINKYLGKDFKVLASMGHVRDLPKNKLGVDVTAGFVPFANDVPVMVGAGARIARIHEVWGRFGYMTTGDDVRVAFGVAGYRLALRPDKLVRPLFGAMFAGLPATCTHDAEGRPSCTGAPLFIFAATAGVRVEPVPWLGVSSVLSLGTYTYPNPFGMVELGVSFAWPLR